MTDSLPAATTPPAAPSVLERVIAPNVLVLIGAWLFVVAHFAGNWTTIGAVFRDTDDLMRLTQLRDLLAGQGWFDLHQYRLDPPAQVPMHWSRLVDLPMVVIFRLAALVVAAPTAEKVAMFVWPLLTLIPGLIAVWRLAIRLGGPWAALPALYLFATLPQSIGQFVPGRIDHHNIQISLTLVLLATLASPLSTRRAIGAGLTGAAMLAIGMETIPFQVLAALTFVVRFVRDPGAAREAGAWGLALALGTLALAAIELPPGEWLRGACDALSANWIGLAVVGGLGLFGITRLPLGSMAARSAAVGLLGVAAVAAFAAPEPRCLAGPFAQISPEVRAIWLDHVSEVEPWTRFFHDHSAAGVLALVMPVLGVIAMVMLARRAEIRTAPGFWPAVAAAAITFAIGLTQLRTLIYANALAVPLVAAAIGRFAEDGLKSGRSLLTSVLGGIFVANSILPAILLDRIAPKAWKEQEASAGAVIGDPGTANATGGNAAGGSPCFTVANWSALGKLPPALVAAEIDLGPVILVATPHSVVAAPYHRMQRGIVDVDTMLSRPPTEAVAKMAERGVTLVAACTASKVAPTPGGLLAELLAGRMPAQFEEIEGAPTVRVFRRIERAYALTDH